MEIMMEIGLDTNQIISIEKNYQINHLYLFVDLCIFTKCFMLIFQYINQIKYCKKGNPQPTTLHPFYF